MIHMRLIYLLIGIIVILISAVGCSSTKAKYSTLAPEAIGVPVWSMILIDDNITPDSLEAIGHLRKDVTSQYTDSEAANEYFLELINELDKQGIEIDNEHQIFGEIRLTLTGGKKVSISVGSDGQPHDAQDAMDRDRESSLEQYSREESRKSQLYYRFSDGIREARVEFYDMDNRFLGQIMIEGGKIKSEFIAKAIKRMVMSEK